MLTDAQLCGKSDRVWPLAAQRRDLSAPCAQTIALIFDHEADDLVADRGILQRRPAIAPRATCKLDHVTEVERHTADAAALSAGNAAFEGKGQHCHLPAFAFLPHQAIGGDARVGEEGLVEAILARQLLDRLRLDAR